MLKKNGNFTRPVRILISLMGIALCALGLRFDVYLLALAGIVVGAIGMYASKASTVGIKPFCEKKQLIERGKGVSAECLLTKIVDERG